MRRALENKITRQVTQISYAAAAAAPASAPVEIPLPWECRREVRAWFHSLLRHYSQSQRVVKWTA